MDKRTNVSVVRRTRETLGGDPVLHVRFGGDGPGPSFDFYLDPRTMATRRFEQHTPTDSAVTTLANGCVSGWVHLQKAERREIKCLPYADRFGGSPVDEGIVALLPLKANFEAALATYSPMAGAAAATGKIARDVTLLAQSEIAEAREGGAGGGSSAMPHKRNPKVAERICGLARIVRAQVTPTRSIEDGRMLDKTLRGVQLREDGRQMRAEAVTRHFELIG
jgi:hypothetical protein